MTSSTATPASVDVLGATPDASRPPGERYYRHPGDVLQLVFWGACILLVALLVELGTDTSRGLTSDVARVGDRLPLTVRELLLALAQVLALLAPIVLVAILAVSRRWRRLGSLTAAGAGGAVLWLALDRVLDVADRVPGAVESGTWVASTRFPGPVYLAAAVAVAVAGRPWLPRSWHRAAALGLGGLVLVLVIAGSGGVLELLLAVVAGGFAGAALLVAVGAPNRRPTPAAVTAALGDADLDVVGLELLRAEGGRSQLYRAVRPDGTTVFVKVYGHDSRSADLLYRGYRTAVLRGTNDARAAGSLQQDVEHEALLLIMARDHGVHCPAVELLTQLPDGSMVLALEDVGGPRLDELDPAAIDDGLLDATWNEVQTLHRRRIAHRALRAANILVPSSRPVVIDLGFGVESAPDRLLALDRAELLTSLAVLVGADRAVTSAARVLGPDALVATMPFLQPLALSAATRKQASKALLDELRTTTASTTGRESPVPLERLVRVKPRTLLTIALLTGAFYALLPQLADAGDSVSALRDANWGWLLLAVVMSGLTYMTSAIALVGGVPGHVPLGPAVEVQMASSFVNRVTPANVGGMALNVRFLQKAGIDSAASVTGVGLNALVGGVIHVVLLVVFFALAGQDSSQAFKIPSSSTLLVVIAVALALAGIVVVTRKGRRLVRTHVFGFLRRSWQSLVTLATSPVKLVEMFGGSAGVTLAYIGALAAAMAAFSVDVTFAQIGAVYLGASIIAAAAPTPGGLGALEAALVAGFTGIGVDSGVAVAAVLSYRLATYWLPILPGWLSFRHLQQKGLV